MNNNNYGGGQQFQNTDEFLAVKFPGIKKSWLREVCKNLQFLGGSGDMFVSFRGKKNPLTKWTFLQNDGSGEAYQEMMTGRRDPGR